MTDGVTILSLSDSLLHKIGVATVCLCHLVLTLLLIQMYINSPWTQNPTDG